MVEINLGDPARKKVEIGLEEYVNGWADDYLKEYPECTVKSVCNCGAPTVTHKIYMKLDPDNPPIPDNLMFD
jgi:hypothetical protein